MFKKILKWTGAILLFLIIGVSIVTYARQHVHYNAPYPNIKATKDTTIIAQGRRIVLGAGHCVDCHSKSKNIDSILRLGQEPVLSGGNKFDLPFGVFYTRNITPDSTTGIGRMTDPEIARMLRYGVKKNGEAALPFMPFQNMTDDDLTAVVSYLHSLKPIHNPVPDHSYNVIGSVIKAYMIKPVGPTEAVQQSIV